MTKYNLAALSVSKNEVTEYANKNQKKAAPCRVQVFKKRLALVLPDLPDVVGFSMVGLNFCEEALPIFSAAADSIIS